MRFDTLMTIAVVLMLTSCYFYLWNRLRSKTSS
ncbi:hypothetical protein DES34_101451 [Brevibacillus brevis]|nr:hypothetical protein DES34_101451 [Brevibacillus brevis]TQK53471.1 hypothetical protein FB479_110111 [Brevibacillus sp. AG162]VEF89102.1 Uncharacterised protein [Brevibacillus brevis]